MNEPQPTDRNRLLQRLRQQRFGEEALREADERDLAPAPTGAVATRGGLSSRIEDGLRQERQTCDLLLLFRDGPRLFQNGNFINLLSDGTTSREVRNHVQTPRPKQPSYILLNLPRHDLGSLPAVLPRDNFCELFAPSLGRRYRFSRLSSLQYNGEAGPVPMLRVTSFPYLELTLSGKDPLSGRLRNLMATREMFGACLGEVLQRSLAPISATALEVQYWIHHTGPTHDGAIDFNGDDIECLWSADHHKIAEELNHSVEVGARFVSIAPVA